MYNVQETLMLVIYFWFVDMDGVGLEFILEKNTFNGMSYFRKYYAA